MVNPLSLVKKGVREIKGMKEINRSIKSYITPYLYFILILVLVGVFMIKKSDN